MLWLNEPVVFVSGTERREDNYDQECPIAKEINGGDGGRGGGRREKTGTGFFCSSLSTQ